MKNIAACFTALLFPFILSGETDTLLLKSVPVVVTMYPAGAQVTRQAEYALGSGIHKVKLSGLAEGIDPATLQVKCIGDATILSVSFRETISHTDPVQFNRALDDSLAVWEGLRAKLKDRIRVIDMELNFLDKNKVLGGVKKSLKPEELRAAIEYYRLRLSELMPEKSRLELKIQEAYVRIEQLRNAKAAGPDNDAGVVNEADILLQCEKECKGKLLVSYFTRQAHWKPIYDLRLEDPSGPLRLTRRAVASNSTTESWADVRMKFATANPRQSSDKPVLRPVKIMLQDEPVIAKSITGRRPKQTFDRFMTVPGAMGILTGRIADAETDDPIPFANVVLKSEDGVQAGIVTTDFDGIYIIRPVAPGTYSVECSFIGYASRKIESFTVRTGKIEQLDMQLFPSATTLEDVEITTYKKPLVKHDEASQGSILQREGEDRGITKGYISSDAQPGDKMNDNQLISENIRGNRSNAEITYIDGIKVIGSSRLSSDTVSRMYDPADDLSVISSADIQRLPNRASSGIAASVGGIFPNKRAGNISSKVPYVESGKPGQWVTVENRENLTGLIKDTPAMQQFEVDQPVSLPPDGADYIYDLGEDELKVTPDYYVAPVLNRKAFVMVSVPGWDNLMMASGEAGVWFGDTYVGKTVIDGEQMTDTALISLGADPWLVTERRLLKELSSKTFSGSKRIDTRTYEITLRNTRDRSVNVTVEDQIPVSVINDIEVEVLDHEGAVLKKETGVLTWKLNIPPTGTVRLRFGYSLKYPKSWGNWKE